MKNFKSKPPVAPKEKPGIHGGSVKKYMATRLITFQPDTDILDAIDTLLKHQISGAPVLNEKEEVIGMIDDKDCLRVLLDRSYHNQPIRTNKVTAYMDTVMRTIPDTMDITDIATIFLDSTYKRLLVVDNNKKLIGQISRSDVLRAISELNKRK